MMQWNGDRGCGGDPGGAAWITTPHPSPPLLASGLTGGRAGGLTGGRASGRTGGRADGRTGGQADGHTGERTDTRTGGRTDFDGRTDMYQYISDMAYHLEVLY